MRWCLTSSSSPYCWTCCLFVLYVIGAEALAVCFSLRWRLGSVYLSLPLVFSFYSPWKWSRLSTTSDTAGKRTLSLILSAQKLMKQLEIFVISTQNFKCCFLAWAVEYSWADPGNTHHNTPGVKLSTEHVTLGTYTSENKHVGGIVTLFGH